MTDNRITLSADTKCFKCGGSLLEGQTARWEFDTAINGYVHRHTRSGLCHRRNRDVDHLEVMEAIHGIITNSTENSEAEAAEGNEAEREKESV